MNVTSKPLLASHDVITVSESDARQISTCGNYATHCNMLMKSVRAVFVHSCYSCICCPLYRVEFDAYRSDLEVLQAAPRVGDVAAAQKLEEAQQRYETHKEKFERLRSDVSIKMKFLDENRVNVPLLLSAVTY